MAASNIAERLLSWRHTGFSVHSRVRTKTKPEAERVDKYMIRPLLSLERLSFPEPEGKVGYRNGQDGAERETMDYLEFIALSDRGPDHRSSEVDVRGREAAALPAFQQVALMAAEERTEYC